MKCIILPVKLPNLITGALCMAFTKSLPEILSCDIGYCVALLSVSGFSFTVGHVTKIVFVRNSSGN